MPPKPKRSSDTPAYQGRIGTSNDQSEAQETLPSFLTRRSPEEMARFRAFADVIRDAIGEHGSIKKELSPVEAAERGCLGTLKSLHRCGRETFHSDLCKYAAKGGQLEVLKWLRENGCTWGGDVRGGGVWRAPRGDAVVARDAAFHQCSTRPRGGGASADQSGRGRQPVKGKWHDAAARRRCKWPRDGGAGAY